MALDLIDGGGAKVLRDKPDVFGNEGIRLLKIQKSCDKGLRAEIISEPDVN